MGSTADQPTVQQGLEAFGKTISVYEHRVGHICRQVASQIAGLLESFPTNGRLLDNACGTGAVTEEFLKAHPSTIVSAIDITPPMVDAFRSIINNSPLLTTQVKDLSVEDAQALPYPDDTFDASIMNFGIFFLPDPVMGVKQMHRTLKSGGTAVVTTWKTFGFDPIWKKVQDRIAPAVPLVELPLMGPWCNSSKLEGVLKEAGFTAIQFHAVEAGLWGTDPEDFKSVLLESFGAFVSRAWSDEEKSQLPPVTSSVVNEMLSNQDPACVRDGERIGCIGDAWVAICTK